MVADVVPFDAVLQSPTFSLIHRLKLYHQDPAIRSILYLNGGAEEFEDIPKEIQGTDELLLLKNLTVTPLEFKQWVDSTYVKYAVTRVFFLPKDQFATNKEELLKTLQEMPSPLQGAVRIMAFPKPLEHFLSDGLVDCENWELHPVTYKFTLHAVYMTPTCIRYAVRPANETFLTASTGPSRSADHICRAAPKLMEALHVSGFEMGTGAAVDVGAAPGGWTALLASKMRVVAAVDPAELDAAVAALPNVVHIKKKSEDALAEISAALGGGNDSSTTDSTTAAAAAAESDEGCIDLLTCDANKHPENVLKMLQPLLGLLRPGGLAVVTMKFRGKSLQKALGLEELSALLGDGFSNVKVVWLLANTQNERTLLAVKS